jgi:hypothetical protein
VSGSSEKYAYMIRLENYRKQIETYFKETDPIDIIRYFESLGYVFEPIDPLMKDIEVIDDQMKA